MMGFRALLYAYVVGGLTFIPLLIAAILIPAWYLLPQAETRKSTVRDSDAGATGKENDNAAHARKLSGDAAASGTYAVLRRYDFQAALSALNGRQNSTVAAGGNTVGEDMLVSEGGANAASGSVYQSMYRSVFTGGSKNSGSTTSLLQNHDEETSVSPRKPAPANLLYIVLRHGHLMLYDSPAQVEVKHVLSLAHHKVSLQAGKDDDSKCLEASISEADLFTKRTAIVLTPIEMPNGSMQTPAQAQARPFYLFTATNIDKEDFYHALVSNRRQPPTPRSLDSDALIKLQSSLHSSSLTAESRAIDALIGRIFLALHRTEAMNSFVRNKLERKLNRIQKPAFIPSLLVQSIHLGDAGPVISNLKLRDLNIDGEMTLSADMKYNGGLSVTLLAVAKLDLGSRFKVRTVDLALKTVIQRIAGIMLLRVKPPPSNRIWFCFESLSEMDVRVEPVVSERKITYGFVLRAIEERVRTAFKEGLVKPNWDDIPMPFSDTLGKCARGGLWSDMGTSDTHVEPTIEQTLAQRNEKTMSLPALVKNTAQELNNGSSTGTNATAGSSAYKVRQSMTMPTEPASDRSPRPPRPLRTPSVSSPASTAVDGQNVEPVRREDATLSSHQPRKLWRSRGADNSVVQRDALEELRGLQIRSDQVSNASGASTTEQKVGRRDHDAEEELTANGLENDRSSVGQVSTTTATTRTPSIRSTISTNSTTAPSIASSEGPQGRKANILAATLNATNAAKNWSWNAIQRNKGAIARLERKQDISGEQPMGRGMPLPPPGQPLPGPQKGLWGGVNVLRRRPVASAQGTATSFTPEVADTEAARLKSARQSASSSLRASSPNEEEFEPWQENSGSSHVGTNCTSITASGNHAMPATSVGENCSSETRADSKLVVAGSSHEAVQEQVLEAPKANLERVPPPLPARRHHDYRAHDHATASPSPTTEMIDEDPTEVSDTGSISHNADAAPAVAETPVLTHIASTPFDRDDTKAARIAVASTVAPPRDRAHIAPSEVGIEVSRTQTVPTAQTENERSTVDFRSPSSNGGQLSMQSAAIPAEPGVTQFSEQVTSTGSARTSEDGGHADAILARMQARVAERRSAEGVERDGSVNHKTSTSIGFSDGWPSH